MLRTISALGFAVGALAACNGHDELCSRKYSEITYLGAHDSAFVGELPTNDQYVSVGDQLALGVRFMEAQTHDDDGTIEMCHTSCLERDAGPLTDYLQGIADFMNANPNEVATVLLTNGDAITLDRFDAAFDSVGLKGMVFIPDGNLGKDDWPTLQEMIDAGTRLVVLMGKFFLRRLREYSRSLTTRRLQCRYLSGQLHPPRVRPLLGDHLWCH